MKKYEREYIDFIKETILRKLNNLSIMQKWEWFENEEQKGFVSRDYDNEIRIYVGIQTHVDQDFWRFRSNAVLPLDLAMEIIDFLNKIKED